MSPQKGSSSWIKRIKENAFCQFYVFTVALPIARKPSFESAKKTAFRMAFSVQYHGALPKLSKSTESSSEVETANTTSPWCTVWDGLMAAAMASCPRCTSLVTATMLSFAVVLTTTSVLFSIGILKLVMSGNFISSAKKVLFSWSRAPANTDPSFLIISPTELTTTAANISTLPSLHTPHRPRRQYSLPECSPRSWTLHRQLSNRVLGLESCHFDADEYHKSLQLEL